MRRQSQCDLHQDPPRAVHALRRMPARCSSAKHPEVSGDKVDLVTLGFWVADSGPHTSKTLMLQEPEILLAAIPADAPAKAYRTAIVEENALGKRHPVCVQGNSLQAPVQYGSAALGCGPRTTIPTASVLTSNSKEEG